MGGHATVEGRDPDPPHPDHRAERARDDKRPRPGAESRRRRFRYEACAVRAAARKNRNSLDRRCGPMTRQGSVLIVDDSEPNRDVLSRRLLRNGFLVETAADGHAALALAGSRAFDVVLL